MNKHSIRDASRKPIERDRLPDPTRFVKYFTQIKLFCTPVVPRIRLRLKNILTNASLAPNRSCSEAGKSIQERSVKDIQIKTTLHTVKHAIKRWALFSHGNYVIIGRFIKNLKLCHHRMLYKESSSLSEPFKRTDPWSRPNQITHR